jgi:2-succinyl-5-enolpyruvyl-6-hydroxy-3-cyclohexene-1-carboxylate synthase
MAIAFHALDRAGRLRLHVRIDERSAAFTALGMAKAQGTGQGGRPVAILCTSGTAAANFHPAIIEASESGIPLVVLTADRPTESRAAGASQTIDQVKLYGDAVRWYADPGVPERRPGAVAAWRSLACQAYALSCGATGTFPGPVHVNLPFREPLVPGDCVDWPEPLDGRLGGAPWTRVAATRTAARPLTVPWTQRGVVVCGDGDYEASALLALAEQAGWPVLAEPSSNARRGPNAMTAYQYLLASPEFMASHQPEVIISAGRPGLSRPQSAVLRIPGARHVAITQGPGHWADQARAATDVAAAVELTGLPEASGSPWLDGWQRADAAARDAVDAILDEGEDLSEPRLARDLLRALPEGALLWVGSSMPIRDVDNSKTPARADVRVLSSRGASGIDGSTSSAIGAALVHDGPAFALIGDLAFVHDAAGLAIGPDEPRPGLCLIVVNNDGGGIFSTLEQARYPDSFERLFGTRHGADLGQLAGSFAVPYSAAEGPDDLAKAVCQTVPGTGLRVVEVRVDRAASAALRARLHGAALRAVAISSRG